MTREEFLNNTWKKYPKVSAQRDEFVFGRIVKLENQEALVKRDHKITTIEWLGERITSDNDWGEACSVHNLRLGDVVAVQLWPGSEVSFYLLSPNLKQDWLAWPDQDQWFLFKDIVKNCFRKNDFHPLETDSLVLSPGVDHHLDPLQVVASQTGRQWCLPTSPEIALKKHLCHGLDKIFEIKTCYRDDLPGPWHQAEFVMLEWYRSYSPLSQLVQDCEELLRSLQLALPELFPAKPIGIETSTVAAQFSRYLDFNLQPETSEEELRGVLQKENVDHAADDDWNTLFFRLFMEKIEPHLGFENPLALFDFPAQQASLAQINERGWAERFELFWQGVELANAYCEVNDPDLNRQRFERENHLRKSSGKNSFRDESFFNELALGMPPCAGIALGLQRLYWLLTSSLSQAASRPETLKSKLSKF